MNYSFNTNNMNYFHECIIAFFSILLSDIKYAASDEHTFMNIGDNYIQLSKYQIGICFQV